MSGYFVVWEQDSRESTFAPNSISFWTNCILAVSLRPKNKSIFDRLGSPSSRSNPMQYIREKIDRLIKNLTLVMEPIGNGQSTSLFGCVIRVCSTYFLN